MGWEVAFFANEFYLKGVNFPKTNLKKEITVQVNETK
jgi:hypothetical protein